MKNNQHSVYVQGGYVTQFGELYDQGLLDLLIESAHGAIADAEILIADIDAIYVSNMLGAQTDNLQHLGSQLAGVLGVCVPSFRFESACASGSMAASSAYRDVAGGHFKNVLVLGAEKMSELSPKHINNGLMQATNQTEQMSGITFAGLYALLASHYLDTYNLERNILSWVPLLMHRNGARNPKAQFQKDITINQIESAREILSPFGLFDCSPLTDGAAAIVLSAKTSQVQVIGSSMATDTPDLGSRQSLLSFSATKQAFKGLALEDTWQKNLVAVEAHDCFSIALIIALEDLGLADPGKGWEVVQNLYTNPKNFAWTLNHSGGLKAAGHPVGATGIKQMVSVYQQLVSAPKNSLGLTHNLGGTGGTAVLNAFRSC
jgi:acetyl-CoA C-acetyltransferase